MCLPPTKQCHYKGFLKQATLGWHFVCSAIRCNLCNKIKCIDVLWSFAFVASYELVWSRTTTCFSIPRLIIFLCLTCASQAWCGQDHGHQRSQPCLGRRFGKARHHCGYQVLFCCQSTTICAACVCVCVCVCVQSWSWFDGEHVQHQCGCQILRFNGEASCALCVRLMTLYMHEGIVIVDTRCSR